MAVILVGLWSTDVPARDVTAKVIDGLGRPVKGAVLDIHWLKSTADDDVRRVNLVKLTSDENGVVKGAYSHTAIPNGETLWVDVEKEGYSGYSTDGWRPEFVLEREFDEAAIQRIAELEGDALVTELREALAGSAGGIYSLAFTHDRKLRPALRQLITDQNVGTEAGQILAFVGDPEDVRLFLKHPPSPSEDFFANRWAYGVVTALLEPTTKLEWEFLRRCALNELDDLWVDAGAIQSLKLIASAQSRNILADVKTKNEYRAEYAGKAIAYIDSNPPPLSDADLEAAGKKVAEAVRIGNWEGNKEPRYNLKGDKALVDCEFIAGRDLLIYTATFHKVNGIWRLRGVRETMQALLARKPDDTEDDE